jgi:hypothetical protein
MGLRSAIASLPFFAACASPPPEYEALPADCSLWDVEMDLFEVRCVDGPCHGAGAFPAAGLDLETPGVEERIVGAPSNECRMVSLVDPGDDTGGVFVEKLTDDPPCGLQMPLGEQKLTHAEVECVREWTASAATDAE